MVIPLLLSIFSKIVNKPCIALTVKHHGNTIKAGSDKAMEVTHPMS